ncbi:MAG: ATP-binding protein, partial [Anaerolineae bacterium]|nr:ATP-binding protein [Anaerolineae bacterium]
MSIRLRLTLIYSGILALTLIIFSTGLYLSQVRLTVQLAEAQLARPQLFSDSYPNHTRNNNDERPNPRYFRDTIRQIRDVDGNILAFDPNWDERVELPLSDVDFRKVSQGKVVVDFTEIDQEQFIVRSQLITDKSGESRIIQVATSLNNRDRYLSGLRTRLITGSILAVLIAFGVGWVLAGLTLRPINRIRQTAQAIGTERDFSKRVDYVGPNDEVGQLATTFNSMLIEIQAAFHQVEQSLKTQQQFVADASHELRTPLTTLRGNIDLLQRDPPLSQVDQTDILNDMESESERLIRLVNELLILARADARRPLRREPLDLNLLVEEVCQQIKVLAQQRQIQCDSSGPVQIVGDPDAIRQVLLILLDNAIKHTPPTAAINLTLKQTAEAVTLQVADTGPGIAPEQLPPIFDRFYQGETARSGSSTGLGLAIANELTEAQNGTISVAG